MGTYTLTINKNTKKGNAFYSFLKEIECIVDNKLIIDERKNSSKNLIEYLIKEKAIKSETKEELEKIVYEKFKENRKTKGKLSEKELMILNSQINISKYLKNNEI